MKKLGFGIVWFLLLNVLMWVLGGMVAGFVAGAKDPANAAAVGEAAGRAFTQQYSVLILVVSVLVAGAGSYLGLLPGTKSRNG